MKTDISSSTDIFSINDRYSTTRRVSYLEPNMICKLTDKNNYRLFSKPQSEDYCTGGMRTKGYFKHSCLEAPLVTIITIVYNGYDYVEQTIKSVLDQTYDNVEYIIVDGKSTDGTLDTIKKHEKFIDYWVSDIDNGISDAMNKGISLSNGEYVIFIHADDYLISPTCLEDIITQIGSYDIVMCDILFGSDLKNRVSRGFNFWMNFKTGVYHQGAICKRSIFERIGMFDTNFKIAMDYDFFLRAYRYKLSAKKIPIVLSIMRDTGISSKQDWKSLLQRFNEEKKVHYKNYNSSLMYCSYFIYWCLYPSYRLIKQVFKW